jgi:hypothetical protein
MQYGGQATAFNLTNGRRKKFEKHSEKYMGRPSQKRTKAILLFELVGRLDQFY